MDLYWPDRPRNLMSFAYFGGWDLAKFRSFGDLDILVDSGAFTAFTKGKVIDRDAYCEWLGEISPAISLAISLDVIGDWQATRRNHEAMEDVLGNQVTLLPAWHLGSPPEELHRLCSRYPYVAIGGCVPYAKRPKVLMAHLTRAHRIASEHGTELHGLGITGRTSMTALPWRSVDSSSYAQVHMFGHIELLDWSGHRHNLGYGERLTMEERRLCRAYGLDPARVESQDYALVGKTGQLGRDERRDTLLASARAAITTEGFLRRKHGTELKLYFAATVHEWYITTLVEAHSLGNPFAAPLGRLVS
jgi:hypothetical protein